MIAERTFTVGVVLAAATVAATADGSFAAGPARGGPPGSPTPVSVARGPAAVVSDTTYGRQTSPGEVTLELEPRWLDSVLVVQVSANTHTVDLSRLDLGDATRLVIDDTEHAPAEAGTLSGHHGRTTLTFRLPSRPARFAIVVRNVPDVPTRKLVWPKEPGPGAP